MASSEPLATDPEQRTVETTSDASDREAAEPPRDDAVRPTTILLWEAEGTWRATQRGVDAVGRGPSAPLAAAQYCRQIAASVDGDAGDGEPHRDGDARSEGDATPDDERAAGRSSGNGARENGTSERGAASASAAWIDGAERGPACGCGDPTPER